MDIINQISNFKVSYQQLAPTNLALIFITDEKHQLYQINGQIPTLDSLEIKDTKQLILIGDIAGISCYATPQNNIQHLDILEPISIRYAFSQLTIEHFQASLLANHINSWYINHKFCGRCGGKNILLQHEWATTCTQCNHHTHTIVYPCVIGLICRGNEILLAKNKNTKNNMYSCIAGFVNPGESLEIAFARETMEEVGLSIKNIQYFASQQWPFPASLMVGFTAEYEAGEINVDYNELADAKWVDINELDKVTLPTEISIAYRLIQHIKNKKIKFSST